MLSSAADLAIVNAHVRTMRTTDQSSPVSAIAISDGVISAVGSKETVLRFVNSRATVVDADGATVTPGLIDSHMHPTWGADLTFGVDLGGLGRAGVLDALRAEADKLPEQAWVRG